MKLKIADPQTCLNLISVMILLVGLGSAVLIYRTAENDSNSVLGYEIIGGQAYPIMPEDSKMYLHDLQLYSGKAGVLADEFRRWFVGLWYGKSLAFTVAYITLFISFVVFYAANHLPSRLKSDVHSENSRDGTD
jgi:ABC-type multidrug transport system permease subunit